jgi:hypothetical protein
MSNNPLDSDPKTIWHNQNTEDPSLPVQDIRRRAKMVTATLNLRRFVFYAAGILYFGITIAAGAFAGAHASDAGWTGFVRFALLLTWLWSLPYYIADRPIELHLNAGTLSGLELYRRELQVRLQYFQNPYRWGQPIVFMVLFFLSSLRDAWLAVAVGVALVIVTPLYYRQKNVQVPKIRAELDNVRAVLRES